MVRLEKLFDQLLYPFFEELPKFSIITWHFNYVHVNYNLSNNPRINEQCNYDTLEGYFHSQNLNLFLLVCFVSLPTGCCIGKYCASINRLPIPRAANSTL